MTAQPFICPFCRERLTDSLGCPNCSRVFPTEHGVADFAEGAYYDTFDETTALSAGHLEGLRLEVEGTRRRILDYYLPKLRAEVAQARDACGPAGEDAGVPERRRPGGWPGGVPPPLRVLDCGCGNGLSVDLLHERGFEAWGNDLSQLRKWQWRERTRRDRLVVASALSLPFPDDYFDVVISSGVIEHIGVEETSIPRYRVTPLPNRDALRASFLRELLRVGKTIYLDCPNGAFPIDFWHSDGPGRPRFHSTREGFLPTYREIRALVPPGVRVEALSPYKRLQFRQAAQHWHGRLLARPAEWYLRWMPSWLAKSALNPFLVVRLECGDASRRS